MSVETDIAIMLAIILSPNRCRLGKRRARLVRGPRDFSRGIRTQFSRTEGSGAPLRRDAVSSSGSLCCPEFFFGTFRFSFRSVFRLKRESPTCSFGGPEFPPGAVRAGPGCLAARRRPRRGRRRRGRGYMVDRLRPGKFFRSLLIVFSILSTSCG